MTASACHTLPPKRKTNLVRRAAIWIWVDDLIFYFLSFSPPDPLFWGIKREQIAQKMGNRKENEESRRTNIDCSFLKNKAS